MDKARSFDDARGGESRDRENGVAPANQLI